MKNLPLTLILLFILIGCKEEVTTLDEPTAEEMIARTWQVQSVQINGQDENAADFNAYRFTFRSDKTYRFLMPDERQGNWELTANATLLLLDQGTNQEESVAVLELSESDLLLEFTEESVKLGPTQTRFSLVP
jgi:hypothetical protein